MESICLATNNAHKIEEIRAILGARFQLLSLADIGCTEELPETADTIPGNSRQKAEYVFHRYQVACVADDSGLEIGALSDAPGVHSAYYGGSQRSHAANIQRVLSELAGNPRRAARFRTVLTWVSAQRTEVFEGILKGTIIDEPRGGNGFGYDPIFLPEGYTRTLAELSPAEKNAMSHRAQAVQKFAKFLSSGV
jgi:XTP/dITP diphosphohydrolase